MDKRPATRSRAARAAVLVWLASLLASPASAFEVAALFGGDVRSLAVHPGRPDLVAAGTSAGQVYLSRDGGRIWADAGAPLPFPGWVVGTLVFEPEPPHRLWAGLWGLWGSGLVAASGDLGRSWDSRAWGLPSEPVYALEPVPGRPGHLYAGTRSGVWASRDGGDTWRHLSASYPEVQQVSSLLVDPEHPDRVLAGTWQRAYRSDNGGGTWRAVLEGMDPDTEVMSLLPVPGRAGEVWASTCGWVYHSRDLGEHWTRFTHGLDERRTPSLAVLPGGRLLAGTIAGLYASDDGGESWRLRTPEDLGVRAVVHHPARPRRVLAASEGAGVWRSDDGGESFVRSDRGMTNLRVAALAAGNGEVLAAVRDAGPVSGIYRSGDGGRSFRPERVPLQGVLSLSFDGGHPFTTTDGGVFERTGGAWRRAGGSGNGQPGQEVAEGGNVPPPPIAGRRTAVGRGWVLAGEDGVWYLEWPGASWRRLAGGPARVLATGDERYPFLVAGDTEARLFDARSCTLGPRLDLFFPARDLLAATTTGGRLLLGTSGYGLVAVPLPGPGR